MPDQLTGKPGAMTASVSAFARLRGLLGDTEPAGEFPSIDLHLGEARVQAPPLPVTELSDVDGWSRYPPIGGTTAMREAYAGWLARQFGVRRAMAGALIGIEPTPGTKQAVVVTIALAVARARGADAGVSVVMPNPFYPAYLAGALAGGASPVFYTLESGDDPAPIADAVRSAAGSVAAVVVCDPGNPRGEVLSAGALRAIGAIAAGAGAVLVVDECYTELAFGRAPTGYLSLIEAGVAAPGRFVVLHSLSKRSSAPGLRSGFAAGDPLTTGRYADYNRNCGVSSPLPVCAAATALWADDSHVARLRSLLARNWELADAVLGDLPGYRRPDGGFFIWMPVADDEETARRLWQRHALRVMPGRYLAAAGPAGVNPGAGYVRIALVHEEALMRQALTRLRAALKEQARAEATP